MHHLVGVLRSRTAADGADVTLVTSPSGGLDACSIIALNLAVSAGSAGARVLLVISDPQQYETRPSTGGSALARRGRTSFADRVVRTPWRGVEFLRQGLQQLRVDSIAIR